MPGFSLASSSKNIDDANKSIDITGSGSVGAQGDLAITDASTNYIQSLDAELGVSFANNLASVANQGLTSQAKTAQYALNNIGTVSSDAIDSVGTLADNTVTANANLARSANDQLALLAGKAFDYAGDVTTNANALIADATRPQSTEQTNLLKNIGWALSLAAVGMVFALRK